MNPASVDLSIIIVSFNAPDFLKLTLDSVLAAKGALSIEIIVIDNANNPGIIQLLKQKYPKVKILPNTQNLGFAKANNLGLKVAKGRLALLLNPDTLVAEDTFEILIKYYKEHLNTAGLGVMMLNGTGRYLKESKRGFPTLSVALYKLMGLCKVFPHSPVFAKYYEGHLDKNKKAQVDVLSGAFLAMPRQQNGSFTLLDEAYFMYGEDIDLSYRLSKKGGHNIYLPQAPIIHFKGQSTPKNPHTIFHFYHAMWLFYKQHLMAEKSVTTNILVRLSIKSITALKQLRIKVGKSAKETSIKLNNKNLNLISNNKDLHATLQKQLNTHISLYSSPPKSSKGEITLFELGAIPYKQVINTLKNKRGSYGFITEDKTSLIVCLDSKNKGTIIPLS
ncbi:MULTISPECIES: glycosyltransferase family 2 protein [unclassified Carboxylicivirga]|uniref:glycosyltransferase family 2 protein n=1 Tax=Carboxylicivirga TaxID=1628153 RepID=UPI003D33D426